MARYRNARRLRAVFLCVLFAGVGLFLLFAWPPNVANAQHVYRVMPMLCQQPAPLALLEGARMLSPDETANYLAGISNNHLYTDEGVYGAIVDGEGGNTRLHFFYEANHCMLGYDIEPDNHARGLLAIDGAPI